MRSYCLVIVLIGCGEGVAGRPDAETPVPISGTLVVEHVTEAGVESIPSDLSKASVVAIEERDGVFTEWSGSGESAGTFSIEGVPEGSYYLALSGVGTGLVPLVDFTQLDSRAPDLSCAVGGRPDVERLLSFDPPTSLLLSATNLATWQENDRIEVAVPNAGTKLYWQDWTNLPPVGTTSMVDASCRFWLPSTPLIGGSAGDVAYAYQLQADGPLSQQWTLVRFAQLPSFDVTNGQETQVSVDLQTVPQTSTLTVSWRRDLFAELASAVNPRAAVRGHGLDFVAAATHGTGLLNAAGTLVHLERSEVDDAAEDLMLAYGDPFPAAWDRSLGAGTNYWIEVTPSYSIGAQIWSSCGTCTAAAQWDVQPRITPVINPRINGLDAFQAMDGVGQSPTISWDPPLVGELDAVDVYIFGFESLVTGFTLRTRENRITVPPGLITHPGKHVAVITAYSGLFADPDRPYATSIDFASAATVIGPFTP